MFFSGLNNVDMNGLFGLGADMSSGELFNRFRSAIPQYQEGSLTTAYISSGMTDAAINKLISAVLSGYEIRRINISDSEAASIAEKVQSILLGADTVSTARYRDEIKGVVSGLKDAGYALVPIGYSPATPQQPSGTPGESIAYQGAMASQQAGRSQVVQTSGSTNQSTQVIRSQKTGLPVIYRRQAHKQTPADRQRLFWIIGGFGLVFALTIGVIAARSGD